MRVQICEYESRKDGGEEKGKTAKSEWDTGSNNVAIDIRKSLYEQVEMDKKNMPFLLK